MKNIVIVNYGMGNVGSIRNMLKLVGAQAMISSSPEEIDAADTVIIPGVGSFDTSMTQLAQRNLLPVLNKKALDDKTPILGICLGMQLLTARSEEGCLPGLGWIDGETVRFRPEANNPSLKVPHMGWNSVVVQNEVPLASAFLPDSRFYFVHSYHVVCNNEKDVLTKTSYGYDFVSSVHRDNITGVQFHPEKSHKFGMAFFEYYCRWYKLC